MTLAKNFCIACQKIILSHPAVMSILGRGPRHDLERPTGGSPRTPTYILNTTSQAVPQDPPGGLSKPFLEPNYSVDITTVIL